MDFDGSVELKETAIGPKLDNSAMIRRSGSNCRVAVLKAMYLASVVDRAISV